MNDNNLNNILDKNTQDSTYHATSNLNTAIENPQVNIGSATGINIQENVYNNTVVENLPNSNNDNNTVVENTQNYNTNTFNDYQNGNVSSNTEQNNYTYQPTMKENKKSDNTISNIIHSKESKLMIFIIFILILFLLVMPYIYDFFINL